MSHQRQAHSGSGIDVSRKNIKVRLTIPFGTVSTRLEPLRVVAARSAELLNLASTSRMSNSVTRNLIKPLQHDPISGKFNSQVINAWRFSTTAAALIGMQASLLAPLISIHRICQQPWCVMSAVEVRADEGRGRFDLSF